MGHLKIAVVWSEIMSVAGYTFFSSVSIIFCGYASHLFFSHGFQMQLFWPESHRKIFLNVRRASNEPEYKNLAGSFEMHSSWNAVQS